jgi:hypothetical protein
VIEVDVYSRQFDKSANIYTHLIIIIKDEQKSTMAYG